MGTEMTPILAAQVIAAYKRGNDQPEIGGVKYWVRTETQAEYTGTGNKRRKVKDTTTETIEIRLYRSDSGVIWRETTKRK